MSIGERIVALRKEQKLSQGDLAKALDLSRQAISKWENDLASPDTLNLIKLADVLNTNVEFLATGTLPSSSAPTSIQRDPVQVVEKIVERKVYVPVKTVVKVPVVEYVDRPVIKKVFRTRYRRNLLEYIAVCLFGIMIGVLIGILL